MTRSTGYAAERREMRALNLYRCSRCDTTRHATDFHMSATGRWGLQTYCKSCAADIQRKRQAAKRAVKVAALALVDASTKRCGRCEQVKPVDNFRKRTQPGRTHQHYSTCNECWSAKGMEWRAANLDRVRHLTREWFKKDQARSRAIYRESQRRRLADPVKRLNARISNQIWQVLKGRKSGRKAESLLGYGMHELHSHIERQFLKGMSWENMGEWHIDHIVPLASFTITGPDDPELRRAWALPNLRPLWAEDNIRKHAKRETLL